MKPGTFVSVDQLESPLQGFIGQLKGILTRQQVRADTVFIDHHSDFTYMHVHQSTTSRETIETKESFEDLAEKNQIKILHYHCENGRFTDNMFKQNCTKQGQTFTYSTVSAHHHNGNAEKRLGKFKINPGQ